MPLPGASSAIAALERGGRYRGVGFAFAGFPSSNAQERATELGRLKDARASTVIFEAPHRIEALAGALGAVLGGGDTPRLVTVCRELTKQFEQVVTLPVGDCAGWLAADANHRRGEFVLVLHAAPAQPVQDDAPPADVERTLRVLLRELPLKQAAALAAELTGMPRKRLYAQALAWRADAPADDEDTDIDSEAQ